MPPNVFDIAMIKSELIKDNCTDLHTTTHSLKMVLREPLTLEMLPLIDMGYLTVS